MHTLTNTLGRFLPSFSTLMSPQDPPLVLSPESIFSVDRCLEFLSRRHDELEQRGRDSLFSDIPTIFSRSAILAEWRLAELDFLVFRSGQEAIGRVPGAIWAPVANLPKAVELFGKRTTVPISEDISVAPGSTLIHVSGSRELKSFELGTIATEGFLLFVSLRGDLQSRLHSPNSEATQHNS
jgi:hypothetical protein